MVNVSTVIAFLLKYDDGIEIIPSGILDNAALILCIITFVKIDVFNFYRLYSSISKFAGIHEMISVIGATFVGNGIVLVILEF